MDLKEIGWEGMDWTQVAQDRAKWHILANMVRDSWVPPKAGSFFIRRGTIASEDGLCQICCLIQGNINTYFDFVKLKLLLVNA
jgi:hypothetical protein